MNEILLETQACVIGAGVMGASAAFHLAAQGVRVLAIDKSFPGSEASGATAGTLAIQNKKTAAIPLALDALDLWATLSERLDADVEYEVRGGFRVAHTEQEVLDLEQSVRSQQAAGAPVEMVYQPQLSAAAPYLAPSVRAASYCARDGMANPFAALRAFVGAARRAGAEFWSGSPVSGIEVRGDRDFVVRTGAGAVRCQFIIAAAGAWNLDVARMVGVELPITTQLLQAIITDFAPPLFPHIITHVRGNLTMKQQRVTGKVLIGGAWPGDGDRDQGWKRVRRESLIGNLKGAAQTIPGIAGGRLLRAWVGFEGRTPDKMLLCGAAGPPGFFLLGCAGGGFTLSPVAGRMAAECVAFGRPRTAYPGIEVGRFLEAPTLRSGADA